MNRVCTCCEQSKDLSCFYLDHGKPSAACKECRKGQVSLRYHSCGVVRKKALEANARWVTRNPDKQRERAARYFLNPLNKPVLNAGYNRRRARKRNNGGSYTAMEWIEICDRYGNVCIACFRYLPLTADHVVPLILGGSGSIDNIQPLCKSCNCKKGPKFIDYRGHYASAGKVEQESACILQEAGPQLTE